MVAKKKWGKIGSPHSPERRAWLKKIAKKRRTSKRKSSKRR